MSSLFKITKKDKNSFARVGEISTPHGVIQTPAFTPVGTRASVRGLDPKDLIDSSSQAVLANTYHLYLSPGLEVIEKAGGFAPFMGWSGPTITDSGGYQVSFLWDPKGTTRKVKITDEGAKFTSHIDGARVSITPEKSMQIQSVLSADIIMSFDQPVGDSMTSKQKSIAYQRSIEWEKRSFAEWSKIQNNRVNKQALYAVVQGEDRESRRNFLEKVLENDFSGVALGGQVIGSDVLVTKENISFTTDLLTTTPVHALGLGGGVHGVLAAVEGGIDTFDNTSVTRMARTGILFVYPEDGGSSTNKFKIDFSKSKYKFDTNPVSVVCDCILCKGFTRAYLRHLLVNQEPLAIRLTTIHNITFINRLMERIRNSIETDQFSQLKRYFEFEV